MRQRVEQQVVDHALHVGRVEQRHVARGVAEPRCDVQRDGHVHFVGRFGVGQAAVFQPAGQRHRFAPGMEGLGQREQARYQRFQALHLAQGGLQGGLHAVLAPGRRRGQRVFGLHADGAEGIADFMGQAGGQAAQGRHAFAGHQQFGQALRLAAPAHQQEGKPGAGHDQ